MSRKRASSPPRSSISGADASSSYDDARDNRSSSSRSKSSGNGEPPLSAYWVKFFKSAGFPSDVATRHALVFSNNRIKPDMLPDLDKPSLKEMGITLMGDMIAILRYAKKVVDETTCKKFLVSSEDSPPPVQPPKPPMAKPAPKKIVAKNNKGNIAVKVKADPVSKVVRAATTSSVKPSITSIKKTIVTGEPKSRMYSDYIDLTQRSKPSPLKRKYDSDEEGINGKWVHNETAKRQRVNVDNTRFRVMGPKLAASSSQKILKKALETKRTVFHRLGDSMVTSTTSESHSNFDPTFNITGIGSDYNKRSSSVFNRLGNIDSNPKEYNRFARNGDSTTHGILKARVPLLGTKTIITKSVLKKPVGTMRADEEATRKAISPGIRHLVKTTRNLNFGDGSRRNNNILRKVPITGKLASDRLETPAKSRLGVSKQVTFNKMTTINHVRKQGVFSRLGV